MKITDEQELVQAIEKHKNLHKEMLSLVELIQYLDKSYWSSLRSSKDFDKLDSVIGKALTLLDAMGNTLLRQADVLVETLAGKGVSEIAQHIFGENLELLLELDRVAIHDKTSGMYRIRGRYWKNMDYVVPERTKLRVFALKDTPVFDREFDKYDWL